MLKKIIIFSTLSMFLIGCSSCSKIKQSYDKNFHDNPIEEAIEDVIKDTTNIEVDFSADVEEKKDESKSNK